MKKRRLLFSAFCVVLAVLFVRSLVYKANQSTGRSTLSTEKNSLPPAVISTDEWETVSTKYWTFKVPKGWIADNCSDGSARFIGPALKDGQKIVCGTEYPHPDPRFYLSRQPGFDYPYRDNPTYTVEEDHFKIGGQDAIKQRVYMKNGYQIGANENQYFVKYNGALYTIQLFGSGTSKEEFEAFVSTITFL